MSATRTSSPCRDALRRLVHRGGEENHRSDHAVNCLTDAAAPALRSAACLTCCRVRLAS
jgi:hypothetical protein